MRPSRAGWNLPPQGVLQVLHVWARSHSLGIGEGEASQTPESLNLKIAVPI